jgi:hypothetical protein
MKAADEPKDKTIAPNQLWQTDITYLKVIENYYLRFDAIFDRKRSINGLPSAQRLAVRVKEIVPLVQDFEVWMRAERAKLSRHSEVAKAMDYIIC